MATKISIAELQHAGVTLRAEEAIAIAQKLIHDRRHLPLAPPFGPPSIDNVVVGDDGSVTCRACEATPGVAEIAIFLQSLLPEGAANAPGALRYTIARALHDVDAPPFDSLDALSAALSRHERGDRERMVQRLVARSQAAPPAADGGREDRRHGFATPSDYRRLLREADERLYQQKLALESAAPVPAAAPPRPSRRVAAPIAIAIALAILVVAAAAAALRIGPVSESPSPRPPASPAWTHSVPVAHETVRPASTHPAIQDARRPTPTPPRQPQRPRSKAAVFLSKFRVVDDFQKR